MAEDDWTWQFRAPAKRAYDKLEPTAQDRITDKLEEIVTDQWRGPDEYFDTLPWKPHAKFRSAGFGTMGVGTTI